jgi:hypothetical protein
MPASATALISLPPFPKGMEAIGVWASQIHIGKLACTGTVTLAASATSTSVADLRAGANSFFGLCPLTANAASAQAAGNVYVSTRAKQSFVLTHPSSASTDKTFSYVVLG